MTGKKIVVHKHVSTQKCKIIMINIVAIMNTRNGIHYTSGRNRFRRKSTFESSCEEKTEKKKKQKQKWFGPFFMLLQQIATTTAKKLSLVF